MKIFTTLDRISSTKENVVKDNWQVTPYFKLIFKQQNPKLCFEAYILSVRLNMPHLEPHTDALNQQIIYALYISQRLQVRLYNWNIGI